MTIVKVKMRANQMKYLMALTTYFILCPFFAVITNIRKRNSFRNFAS